MPDCFHFSTGVPPPTLQWFKDAISINKLWNPRYQLLAGGGLSVRQLRPEDSGIFQCLASNSGGEVQTHTYLDVTSECCSPHPAQSLAPGWPQGPGFPALAPQTPREHGCLSGPSAHTLGT